MDSTTTTPSKRVRQAMARCDREADLGVDRLPEWCVLQEAHSDSVVEACRQLIAEVGRLSAPEFFWARFLDESTVDLDRLKVVATTARDAVKPLLAAHHGSREFAVPGRVAGSAFEAVGILANEILRSMASWEPDEVEFDPEPDPAAGEQLPCRFLPRVDGVDADVLMEIYRACCAVAGPASATSKSASASRERQSVAEPVWSDFDGSCFASPLAAMIGLALTGSGADLRSGPAIVDAIERRHRETDFALFYGRCTVSANTVRPMTTKMREEGLLTGSANQQKRQLTERGIALVDAAVQRLREPSTGD